MGVSPLDSDQKAGEEFCERFLMPHAKSGWQKLQALVVMYQKLIGLVRGDIEPDNQDAFSCQGVLLPGQVYGLVLKEALEVGMLKMRSVIRKNLTIQTDDKKFRAKKITADDYISGNALAPLVSSCMRDVGKRLESFISTGNLSSRTGLDLQQRSGFTVVADKINAARFSSHFAAIHRGQYFAAMKTTTVRKLLPETWGFLCPVHTPDGAPCGLLNHLADSAIAVVKPCPAGVPDIVADTLMNFGAEIWKKESHVEGQEFYCTGAGVKQAWIMLDGCPLGQIQFDQLDAAAEELRRVRAGGHQGIPKDMEVVCISQSWKHLFPGLYLFCAPFRLVRPVRGLQSGRVEWIGALEQIFLGIAALPSEKRAAQAALAGGKKRVETEVPEQLPMEYTHEELQPTEMLSVLANLTPFSNHNQSPRNMYQCQMLKQTMGTPYHNHAFRTDNKAYRIMTPQRPIVRTSMYERTECDTHPQGTNAIVAVITYTGYDMEDAMVINKASYDRGFKHAAVYKTKIIAAEDSKRVTSGMQAYFSNLVRGNTGAMEPYVKDIDPTTGLTKLTEDGLPRIGSFVQDNDPLYCVIGRDGKPTIHRYHEGEAAYVENVTLVDSSCHSASSSRVASHKAFIRLRHTRNPVVGDKFSSRHGQKGVMSILWPAEDMPFTDGGVTPDILFNPHGFPSRMTIGMLIESIAAKAAAVEGRPTVNATTFRRYKGHYAAGDDNEDDPFLAGDNEDDLEEGTGAAEYFGHSLAKHGFQRLGTEKMYSGIHGSEIETEIFMGVVYYQRLRHMVAEKAQVRSRGPMDRVTMQPLKGRKRGGGIRFGEMERDSLLAHGASFLLHDRLMRCSDFDLGYVCPSCGSVLSPQVRLMQSGTAAAGQAQSSGRPGENWECPPCSKKARRPVICQQIPVPWVFRYLACEMASMNVRMRISIADRARQVSLSCANLDKDVIMDAEDSSLDAKRLL
mmetsp:Transcript_46373/g.100847  ORF Transcript_46373/g.100847 Transcript_46373/m.100847 type:complete len:960 (-) Transcript_46373:83-2962(-)